MFVNGRGYYIVSIIIILAAVAYFLFSYERKKPKTGEVVVLAVMTAMAIAGRMLFFMTPQFKPCIAVIIITGIMLGRQAGFLCGVLTGFVSDFFFGQGPWTPWQMAAFGLIGLLCALIFSKIPKLIDNKIFLCAYGFVMTFFVYGMIMDTATVFMYTDNPTIRAFLASYATGIVFNLIHALSTVIFLWFLSRPFFKKLRRIQKKYGIYRVEKVDQNSFHIAA